MTVTLIYPTAGNWDTWAYSVEYIVNRYAPKSRVILVSSNSRTASWAIAGADPLFSTLIELLCTTLAYLHRHHQQSTKAQSKYVKQD